MLSGNTSESVRAHLHPTRLEPGEPVEVRFEGLNPANPNPVHFQVHSFDSYGASWLMSASVDTQPDGTAVFVLDEGFDLKEVALVYVNSLTGLDQEGMPLFSRVFKHPPVSVMNDQVGEITEIICRLQQEQQNRYYLEFGDSSAEGVSNRRVMTIVEGLLITKELRFPGVTVVPLGADVRAEEERAVINKALQGMGWACTIDEEDWRSVTEGRKPLAALIFEPVFARDFDHAAQLISAKREQLLALLALNRLARGEPVCTIVENKLPSDRSDAQWKPERRPYQGNLFGGELAGENRRVLNTQLIRMTEEPLLTVACDLLGDTFTTQNKDLQFLRYWSILEFLSEARVPSDQTVIRLDGSAWPGEHNNTNSPRPRAYEYVKRILNALCRSEMSYAGPGANLYESITVWHARRNATAHYGEFNPESSKQLKASFFKHAIKSAGSKESAWLEALKEVVMLCIRYELAENQWTVDGSES